MVTAHRNRSVLIIDDDTDMRGSIVSYFQDMDFCVYQASGGRQGIELCETHHPDLVFTDLLMPGVDGLEVVREIVRTSPETPVVVISGNGSVSYAIEAVRMGAWDYITKPILDFSIIDRITDQVLDRALALKTERAYQESLKNAVLGQERQLARIASSDTLTLLPMRNQIREKFSQFIMDCGFTGDLFVILLELESLKSINEKFGHGCGDQMVVDAAERLRVLVRLDCVIGRIGSDQFVVMVANCREVVKQVSAVRGLFDVPFVVMAQEVFVRFSMGIACFPQDGEGIDSLLHCADIALARAREMGKNRHCFYSRELWEQVQGGIALESGLLKGLERNEFVIYYQPKMDARTRCMVGMEALLRWKPRGDEQLVSPAVFVPALETLGLISQVGAWVLETACGQYVEWRKKGMGPVRLSVNISAIQLHSGHLMEVIKDVLKKTGMEGERLCLELTESIVVKDIVETIATISALAELGIKISIDDFGTGYSSLSYLRDMAIHELKIDRSFVMNLPGDAASVAIVESVLGMSQGMKISVVAEGVETKEQADFLSFRGCHELQGYLFSKPLSAEDFFGWCHGGEYCQEHRDLNLTCNWGQRVGLEHQDLP
jgi:diguanylate cyclase (GGDEF)-like protein